VLSCPQRPRVSPPAAEAGTHEQEAVQPPEQRQDPVVPSAPEQGEALALEADVGLLVAHHLGA
jgi:hypothetical protein